MIKFFRSRYSPNVIVAAERVLKEFADRSEICFRAYREWEHVPTLSNAIRRDDARKAMNDLSDAATVALAVVEEARR